MEHIYTMIVEDGQLSLKSHYYDVYVGDSAAAQKALFYLNAWCAQHGYYFRKRDIRDAHFRLNIAKSLGCKVYEVPCMVAKVQNLVSSLKKNGSLPFKPTLNNNFREFKKQVNPTFYFNSITNCLKRGTK